MVGDELGSLEKQYRNNLYNTYIESKELFICAEELLEQMNFFVAPMLEHRDALDHIMRYFNLKDKEGLTEKAIKELDRALAHELRAYFDIADFVCITIRQEIATSLKRVKARKITKIWSEYIDTKKRIIRVSEEIVNIRKNRSSSMEHIEKYKPIMEEIIDIYKSFIVDIEPKIRKISILK